ncbi:excalibur calcium-binding domain-containing protein [Streptomyces sp. NPDC090306]|uniref:excalibur calcium-binding domain-containing protein n=1 Tax=Streptomyces sp. NPDC090306 TaxID=3365961 RepID=UPI003801D8AC
MTNPYNAPTVRPAPRWARKRFVLPALGLAFFLGIAAGSGDTDPAKDAKPASQAARPAATVTATTTATATATETAEPEPAPTVTKTRTVKVKVTVTAAAAADGSTGGGGSDDDSGGGSTYYANCTAVRAAGAAPIHAGEPGYSSSLDRDGDGTACE